METKVKVASRPPGGDTQSPARATQDPALQEGKPNAHDFGWRAKAWIEGKGWTDLLKVSQDPAPEVRAPDSQPGAFCIAADASSWGAAVLSPQPFSAPSPGSREHRAKRSSPNAPFQTPPSQHATPSFNFPEGTSSVTPQTVPTPFLPGFTLIFVSKIREGSRLRVPEGKGRGECL